MGFDTQGGRYTTPAPDEHTLGELFGDLAGEVRATCMKEGGYCPPMPPSARSQPASRATTNTRPGCGKGLWHCSTTCSSSKTRAARAISTPHRPHSTHAYRRLDGERRATFDRLYTDFFYHRHNRFWQESALRKLPVLLSATEMLTCGEDLGMIPDSVPETMHELQILSLEIQRMPKTPGNSSPTRRTTPISRSAPLRRTT